MTKLKSIALHVVMPILIAIKLIIGTSLLAAIIGAFILACIAFIALVYKVSFALFQYIL